MHYLLKMLILLLLLFSPCVVGCSSKTSESDSERIEAEDTEVDSGDLDDDGRAGGEGIE